MIIADHFRPNSLKEDNLLWLDGFGRTAAVFFVIGSKQHKKTRKGIPANKFAGYVYWRIETDAVRTGVKLCVSGPRG